MMTTPWHGVGTHPASLDLLILPPPWLGVGTRPTSVFGMGPSSRMRWYWPTTCPCFSDGRTPDNFGCGRRSSRARSGGGSTADRPRVKIRAERMVGTHSVRWTPGVPAVATACARMRGRGAGRSAARRRAPSGASPAKGPSVRAISGGEGSPRSGSSTRAARTRSSTASGGRSTGMATGGGSTGSSAVGTRRPRAAFGGTA
mmetsp:Transcript_28115/g.62001  ORF Transcript_28115/g.62001 Transcript_28115/m.62001 type:complete len:201 (+) Transcript_28115:2012-2614(+)